jgi:RHS repeat-associated protein
MQNRIMKAIKTGADTVFTFYIRDAQGNVLGVYTRTTAGTPTIKWAEQYIYGSGRLGSFHPGIAWTATSTYSGPHYATTKKLLQGQRRYELSNHLGNVLATINDRRIPRDTKIPQDNIADYYDAVVLSAQDYYPFGMEMPGRTFVLAAGQGSRYGFNGKEKDPTEFGSLTHYDYGFRIYNPALGRFLSVDPLKKEYPWYTPYQFAGNMPILCYDLDGKEGVVGAFWGIVGEVGGQMIQNGSWDLSKINTTQVAIAAAQGFVSPAANVTRSAKIMRNVISYAMEYGKAASSQDSKSMSDVWREGSQNVLGGMIGDGVFAVLSKASKSVAKAVESIGGTDAVARARREADRLDNIANTGRPRQAQTNRARAAAKTLATAESVHKIAPTVAQVEKIAGNKAVTSLTESVKAVGSNVTQNEVNNAVSSPDEKIDESIPALFPDADNLPKTLMMFAKGLGRIVEFTLNEEIRKYEHNTANDKKK